MDHGGILNSNRAGLRIQLARTVLEESHSASKLPRRTCHVALPERATSELPDGQGHGLSIVVDGCPLKREKTKRV